jgi:hypothetical protein
LKVLLLSRVGDDIVAMEWIKLLRACVHVWILVSSQTQSKEKGAKKALPWDTTNESMKYLPLKSCKRMVQELQELKQKQSTLFETGDSIQSQIEQLEENK